MLKKTITYKDFDNNERTETFLFNLTKAEVTQMELSARGGLAAKIQDIVASNDTEQMIGLFKEIILSAYGEKSPDGKYFVKKPELAEAFSYTEAFSILFMELVTSADAASLFITAVLPPDLTQNNN